MGAAGRGELIEDRTLRDRLHVFMDRNDAGGRVAELLKGRIEGDETVFAVPAGGVPVGYEIARALSLPLDLVIVRKIQIPHNPEAGLGALDPEGGRLINEELLRVLRLSDDEVETQVRKAAEAVRRRSLDFRGGREMPDMRGRAVVVADDGLASGYTMLAAVRYMKKKGVRRVTVAVPTASQRTADLMVTEADLLVCPNVRSGFSFAVADAYERWHDLGDAEVIALMEKFRSEKESRGIEG